MQRIYFVQPYGRSRRGLRPRPASVYSDLGDAVAAARQAHPGRAGVIILAQDVEAVSGWKSRPRVMSVRGDVPKEWAEEARRPKAA